LEKRKEKGEQKTARPELVLEGGKENSRIEKKLQYGNGRLRKKTATEQKGDGFKRTREHFYENRPDSDRSVRRKKSSSPDRY